MNTLTEAAVQFCLSHIEILVIALISLIEISPIKINPWRTLGKFIVRCINGDVLEELHKLQKDVDLVRTDTKKISEEVDRSDARQSRVRILRFDDELLHGQKHTKDHFRQILEDIDVYEDYCDRHPDFRNGVAKHAMSHIKSIYEELDQKGGFLV